MSFRRLSFVAAGFFLAIAAVFATEVVPEIVVGKSDEVGVTSHNSVRCILWDHYAPQNLVCGYFQISGPLLWNPLQPDPAVHLTIRSGTNTVASVGMGAMERDGSTALYNFTIRRDLLKDSFIEVYARTQYVQLNLCTVRVLAKQEYEKLTLSKALGPSHFVGGLQSAVTNAPGQKP